MARGAAGRASPRGLGFLARALAGLPRVEAKLTARNSGLLCRVEAELDLCPDLRSRLESALVDDCPLVSREGGFIRSGYSSRLDQLRELAAGGREWIARYQARAVE